MWALVSIKHQVNVLPTVTCMVLFVILLVTVHSSIGPSLRLPVSFHCHVVLVFAKSLNHSEPLGLFPGSFCGLPRGLEISLPTIPHGMPLSSAVVAHDHSSAFSEIMSPFVTLGAGRLVGRHGWSICSSGVVALQLASVVGFSLLSVLGLLKQSQPLRIWSCWIPGVVGPLLRLVVMVPVSSGFCFHPWVVLWSFLAGDCLQFLSLALQLLL